MKRIINHFIHFYPIWLIMIGVLVASYCLPWNCMQHVIKWFLVFFVAIIVLHPLNVVYGLIGTRGSISLYVFLLIVINVIFSGIYHFAIFKDAGITYDINQPYISYGMFHGKDVSARTFTDTVYSYNLDHEKMSYSLEEHNYQKVEFWYVLKNTFMTSLMQEPSDFFAIASTYNQAVNDNETDIVGYESCAPVCCCKNCNCRSEFKSPIFQEGRDKEKSEIFHWLLILQVFISWIFFGVFISILYNKFRYES